jgi:predicted nucleic acid-binding protein
MNSSNFGVAGNPAPAEMIILDANILIRAVLGRRVRQLIETYARRGVRFFSPDIAFQDAETYLPVLLKKLGKSESDLPAALEYLRLLIETVDHDVYRMFEDDARQRLRGRDDRDWPVLATSMALGCGIWTEDADFFGTGVAVWTTNRVEIFLKAEAAELASHEE